MAPDNEKVKAETILEINSNHKISEKIKELHQSNNQEELENYTKILYNQARLISGLNVENPTELTNLICDMISKQKKEQINKPIPFSIINTDNYCNLKRIMLK